MARLIFPENLGDVVKVGGECYYRTVTTALPATNTGDDVDSVFDDCDTCLGGGINYLYADPENPAAEVILNFFPANVVKVSGVCYVYDRMTFSSITRLGVDEAYDTYGECQVTPPPGNNYLYTSREGASIVLSWVPGPVVLVFGVCYEYVGITESAVTHTGVSEAYSSYDECSSIPPVDNNYLYSGCGGSGTVVLPSVFGNVVEVGGACYGYVGTTESAVTNTGVDNAYDYCDECETVPPPENNYEFQDEEGLEIVVLPDIPGDVVEIGGVCYSYVKTTLDSTTHTSVDDVHETLEECVLLASSSSSSSSSNSLSSSSSSSTAPPVLPPGGDGGTNFGDPHFVIYGSGAQDAATLAGDADNPAHYAPFNVDDNSSVNEIYWFSSVKGTDTLDIKYTCSEFPYTNGGKIITQVVIDHPGGTYTYAVNEAGDGVDETGTPVVGAVGGVTITVGSKTMNKSDCCLCLDQDSITALTLDVSPDASLYGVDQVGGALWYIWKQLSTETSLPVNNPSQADFDGINDYTGIGRATFEAGPNLEPMSESVLVNLTSVLSDIQTASGSIDFNWDPAADNAPDCCDECTDPEMEITITANDGDIPATTGISWCGFTWIRSTEDIVQPTSTTTEQIQNDCKTRRYSGQSATVCPTSISTGSPGTVTKFYNGSTLLPGPTGATRVKISYTGALAAWNFAGGTGLGMLVVYACIGYGTPVGDTTFLRTACGNRLDVRGNVDNLYLNANAGGPFTVRPVAPTRKQPVAYDMYLLFDSILPPVTTFASPSAGGINIPYQYHNTYKLSSAFFNSYTDSNNITYTWDKKLDSSGWSAIAT